jgi:hypothetical protein
MQKLLAAALRAVEALEESIEYTHVPAWSPSIDRRREALQALQAALRDGVEPSGWKLVPLSPTPHMIRAHDEVLQMTDRLWTPAASVTSTAYRAMLLSAPRWDTPRPSPAGTGAPTPVRRDTLGGGKPAPVRRVMHRL